MVYPQDVEPRSALPDSPKPPVVSRPLELVPVIQRIPPVLTVLAEIIRRNTCMDAQPAAIIHSENVTPSLIIISGLRIIFTGLRIIITTLRQHSARTHVSPDIGAVSGHIHRDIAHHPDSAAVRIFLQRVPLGREPVLLVHDPADQLRRLFLYLPERFFWIRQSVLVRPLHQNLPAQLFLYHAVCCVRMKPPAVLFYKAIKTLAASVVRRFTAGRGSSAVVRCFTKNCGPSAVVRHFVRIYHGWVSCER